MPLINGHLLIADTEAEALALAIAEPTLVYASDTARLLLVAPGAPARIFTIAQGTATSASATISSLAAVLALAPLVLGGTVLDTSGIVKPFIRATGQANAVGGDALLSVIETDPAGVDVTVGKLVVAASAGAWKAFTFDSIVPLRVGAMIYRVEGGLSTAVSAGVRFVSLALAVRT